MYFLGNAPRLAIPSMTDKSGIGEMIFRNYGYYERFRVHIRKDTFFFGAHIFNFNQLGKTEWNNRYKELFGTLFNSATVAFYWKALEPYHGQVRFQEEYRDTEGFWNSCPQPKDQPHWRRPAAAALRPRLRRQGARPQRPSGKGCGRPWPRARLLLDVARERPRLRADRAR